MHDDIRPARADDAAALADLTTQLGYPVGAATLERRLASVLASAADDAVLVAVDERDRPIGWLHVGRSVLLEADEHAVLNGLVVDDAHRSGGIGARLLEAAEAWARERGLRTMLVRSRTAREWAHRFYEREGYRLVKTSNVFEKRLG